MKEEIRSFSLIEVIVTIFIFTLIIGAVSALIVVVYRTHNYTWEQSVAIEGARKGIETMVKEIREAKDGEDGSYPIGKAGDKELIFYSDIDKDDQIEKVRYFLGVVNSGSQNQECQTSIKGGSCNVTFSNFLNGTLKSAQIKVSVEGDLGSGNEYVEIFADGQKLGDLCRSNCTDCPGVWQGTATFDVFSLMGDNSIQFLADSSSYVDPSCPHAIKARFELSWTEEITNLNHEFRKGVTNPTGDPPIYPSDQEIITILNPYVRNSPPIFEYFDKNGNKIKEYPAKLKDAKLMKVYLVINVNPDRPPQDFGLESFIQLRNLKEE